jgi:hypothetical protein
LRKQWPLGGSDIGSDFNRFVAQVGAEITGLPDSVADRAQRCRLAAGRSNSIGILRHLMCRTPGFPDNHTTPEFG